ncbi:MAG: DUF2855 family protein [Bacteroidota bacterium]
MPNISALDFTVHTKNLLHTKWVEKSYPDKLLPNQILLKIEQFAFTANNITYGVVGEQMDYWKFFPTITDYGILPTWGIAEVIVSHHSDIQVGQRFYGYCPTSSHLLMAADKVSDKGFFDATEHRRALPSTYNYYIDVERDVAFTPEVEQLIPLFRPLFVTSFLIDDHLAKEQFYGATQLLITSASSKTAQVLAFLLAHRKQQGMSDLKLIGLTSERNVHFVRQLGSYDQVLSYQDVAQIDADTTSIIVDFSGNHHTQFQLQHLLKEHLAYNCLVGLVDWQHLSGEQPLPQEGVFFFAPLYAKKRQQEWGLTSFQQRISESFQNFITAILPHIMIEEHIGKDQFEKLYLDVLNGKVDPKCGYIVRLDGANRRVRKS